MAGTPSCTGYVRFFAVGTLTASRSAAEWQLMWTTRRPSIAGRLAAMLAVCPLLFQNPVDQQRPAFRTRTERVWVTVGVYDGRRPVLGLRASDFMLFDNGVRQSVTEVTATADLGIDVTFVVDVSGSVMVVLERFRKQRLAVVGHLKPIDSIRVVAFGTDVVELVARQPATEPLPVDRIRAAGATSLNDGILISLLERASPGRPLAVIVCTDGQDTSSNRPLADVQRIAERTDAIFFVALASGLKSGRSALPTGLAEAARATGGAVFEAGEFDDLPAAMSRIFADLRSRYLMYYEPTGVSQEGWHVINVRVKDRADYETRGRRGYFIDVKGS